MINIFLLTNFSREISKLDLIGILLGHLIFGIALTQLLDWSWLENLMSKDDKEKMLKHYTWKDLLADTAVITVIIGILFLVTSIFL